MLSHTGPSAIASGLLAPGERTASLVIPEDVGGLVWVRARPLVGSAREVVRGGVTGAWIVSSDAMTKSIGVRVEQMFKHPKYKKYIRRHSKV